MSLITLVAGRVRGVKVAQSTWPLATPIKKEIANWPETQTRINLMLTNLSNDLRLKEPLTADTVLTALGNFLAGEGHGHRAPDEAAPVAIRVGIGGH